MKNWITLIFVLSTSTAFCQFDNLEDGAVRAVVNKLFKGMQTGDTTLVRSCFDPSARLLTAHMDPLSGATRLDNEPIDSFLTQIIRIREQQLPIDEKLLSIEVKTDLPMATAWAPYDFYVNGSKTHSGVNSFQMFKSANGWKIVQIMDTRRK